MKKIKNHFKQTVASIVLVSFLLASCTVDHPEINTITPTDNKIFEVEVGTRSTNHQLQLSNKEILWNYGNSVALEQELKAYLQSIAETSLQADIVKYDNSSGALQQESLSIEDHKLGQLVNRSLDWSSYEGHQLRKLYYLPNGNLYAKVYDRGNASLVQRLPVYVMPGIDLFMLAASKEREQQVHITLNRVIDNKLATHGRVWIGQAGVLGGGKGKKKNNKKLAPSPMQQLKDVTNASLGVQKENGRQELEKGAHEQHRSLSTLPQPKELYHLIPVNPYSRRGSLEKAKEGFKKGFTLKLQPNFYDDAHKVAEAMQLFVEAAKCGNSLAMYNLGEICEQQGNIELAKRWYVLSFQNTWVEDTAKAYASASHTKIISLIKQGHVELKKVFLHHVDNVTTLVEKIIRIKIVSSFYESGLAEPYLSKGGNELKVKRLGKLAEELELALDSLPEEKMYFDMASQLLNQGILYAQEQNYKAAQACFLKCQKLPDALYNLGLFCQNGYTRADGKPDYQAAKQFYKRSGTAESFSNLGVFYMDGLLDGKPNLQKAIKYSEMSGTPQALCNMGIIFSRRYVEVLGQAPDYERAKVCFERSGIGHAHAHLGDFYFNGYITKPNYKLAKYHYDIAIKKGYVDSIGSLGDLYILGYCGLNGKPNYQLFANYMLEAINSPIVSMRIKRYCFYNLGVAYMSGWIGIKNKKPDYEQAKCYFEQSELPQAFYHISTLYEKAHIKARKGNTKYQKALEYYKRSSLPKAKLEIIRLYDSNLVITQSEEERLAALQSSIQEVYDLLPTLSDKDACYIRGVLAYYCKDWQDAYTYLNQAILLGTEEEEVKELVETVTSYLEKELALLSIQKEEQIFEKDREDVTTENIQLLEAV
ncbi:MAG: tetratricopeptide repeat protein [Candidatus Amoebophilus sp.]